MAHSELTVLTLDLGTSATKGMVWRGTELCAVARATVETAHPRPGWVEQDPREWWTAVVGVCAELRSAAPRAFASVDAVGFSAARETFALFDDALEPLGPGIVWSDRRAADEALQLGDERAFRAATGVVLTAGAHAAKLAWVARNSPDALVRARWVLQPRDFVVARLTGAVVTDETLASRTGLASISGGWRDGSVRAYGDRLPPIVPSTTVVGELAADVTRLFGFERAVRVVVGAGDRACEVLGTGASRYAPMVSWGTTANVSVPHDGPSEGLPEYASVSRGAFDGFVVEAGLSAAGAALAWVSAISGVAHDDLLDEASAVAPGAAGLVALPWFAGARAPWWRADAHAALLGLTEAHRPAELARAIVEGIAFDVARCLELVAPERREVALAGGGASHELWRDVLAATADCPVARRAVDDAASVGARLIVGRALGEHSEVDDLNPVVARAAPDDDLVATYQRVRAASDAAAEAVLDLAVNRARR